MFLVEILMSIVLPIFILIGIGYLMDRKFNLDVRTLSRIQFYAISPALLFTIAYESTLSLREITSIGTFIVTHLTIMFLLALAIFTLPAFRENRPILILGTLFTNSGNYGVPLILLTFGDAADKAMGAIGVVFTVQSLMFFTVGLVMFVGVGERNLKATLLQVLRYPVLAGIVLGFLMRGLHIGLPVSIQGVLTSIKGAYVALALISLGVQLSKCPIHGDVLPISSLAVMRLIVSPLLALLLVQLFGFDATVGSVLILAAALPTAVNVFIIASEVNRSVDLASRIVFWTTLASAVVISVVILLIRY